MITAIITCAGSSTRSGLSKNKVLFKMPNGLTVLENATAPFDKNEEITKIIYAINLKDVAEIREIARKNKTSTDIVFGGSSRYQSVYNALKRVKTPWVLIHDGARPFVDSDIVYSCIETVKRRGSAVTTTSCVDTIAQTDDYGRIIEASRNRKYAIQTPQGFETQEILKAYQAVQNPNEFTDDSGIYCKYIQPASTCMGKPENVKLTNPSDFEQFLIPRTGVGYDLHVLTPGRKLILGGVEIEHDKGLLGHSDADVLTHAVMDALLSALSLRDIGYHFSDKDEQYKDISSMVLLSRVLKMVQEQGYKPSNVSAVIMAEKPKLSPHVPAITESLATALGIAPNMVGITCTTSEKVGLVGREEAIAVHAICTVIRA